MAAEIDQSHDLAFIRACKEIGGFFRLCAGHAIEAKTDALVALRDERREEIYALYEEVRDSLYQGVSPIVARALVALDNVAATEDVLPNDLLLDLQEACLFVLENAAFIENELRLESEGGKKAQGKSKLSYLIDMLVILLVFGVVFGLGMVAWKSVFGKKSAAPPATPEIVGEPAPEPAPEAAVPSKSEQKAAAPAPAAKQEATAAQQAGQGNVYFVFAPDLSEYLQQHAEVFLSQLVMELAQVHKTLPVSRSLLPLDEIEKIYTEFTAQSAPAVQGDIPTFKKLLFLADEYSMSSGDKNAGQTDAVPGFIVPEGNETEFLRIVERVAQKFCVRFKHIRKGNVDFVVFGSYWLSAVGFVERAAAGRENGGEDAAQQTIILPADSLLTSLDEGGTREIDFICAGRACDENEWREIMGHAQQGQIGPNPIKAPVLDSILAGSGEISRTTVASLSFSGSFIAQCNMDSRGCVCVQLERGRLSVLTGRYVAPVSCVHVLLPGQGALLLDESTRMDVAAVSATSMVPGMEYEWSVNAVDSVGNVRVGGKGRTAFRFVGAADVPSLVSAVAPSEGRIFRETNRNITLDWTDAKCKSARIKSYDVWLFRPDGSREVFEGIRGSEFSFPQPLSDNDYRWMVVAHSDLDTLRLSGGGGWNFSVRSSFETPRVPVPVSPALDEVVQAVPALVCSVPAENIDPASPVSYLFEVDSSDGFNTQNYHASFAVRPQDRDTVSWSPSRKLAENVRWYWRCRATNGILQSDFCPTSWFSIRSKGQPVEKIVLVRPHEGSRLSLDGSIEWEPVNYGPHIRYSVSIDSRRNFHEPELHFDNLIGTKLDMEKLKNGLRENRKYYWMVRAYDSFSQALVFASDIRSFVVDSSNDAPDEFELLFPEEGASVCAGGGVFVWAPARDRDLDDAVTYSFRLYRKDADEPLFVRDNIRTSVYGMKFDAHLSLREGKAVFIRSGADGKTLLAPGHSYSIEGTLLSRDKEPAAD